MDGFGTAGFFLLFPAQMPYRAFYSPDPQNRHTKTSSHVSSRVETGRVFSLDLPLPEDVTVSLFQKLRPNPHLSPVDKIPLARPCWSAFFGLRFPNQRTDWREQNLTGKPRSLLPIKGTNDPHLYREENCRKRFPQSDWGTTFYFRFLGVVSVHPQAIFSSHCP